MGHVCTCRLMTNVSPLGTESNVFVNSRFLSVDGDVEQKGIPNFWLQIFRNVDMLSPMIRVWPVFSDHNIAYMM